MCYLMIYIVMSAYLTLIVPRIFSFPALIHWQDLVALLTPYVLACIFFGMTVSCLVHYRENVMLLMVFISVPLLFMSGISWPQSNIPGYWQGVSWLFPSTFGVRAFVRLNSMGGTLGDVLPEIRYMWIQAAAYFGTACCILFRLIYFIPTILVLGCSLLRRFTTVTTACARLMKARPVAVSLLRAAGVPASPLSHIP